MLSEIKDVCLIGLQNTKGWRVVAPDWNYRRVAAHEPITRNRFNKRIPGPGIVNGNDRMKTRCKVTRISNNTSARGVDAPDQLDLFSRQGNDRSQLGDHCLGLQIRSFSGFLSGLDGIRHFCGLIVGLSGEPTRLLPKAYSRDRENDGEQGDRIIRAPIGNFLNAWPNNGAEDSTAAILFDGGGVVPVWVAFVGFREDGLGWSWAVLGVLCIYGAIIRS